MADDLQPAGVRAVIEDLGEYLTGAEQMNAATAGIGQAASEAAAQTSQASTGVDEFGKSLDDAATSSGGFNSAVGSISEGVQGLLAPLGALAVSIGAAFAVKDGIGAVNDLGGAISKLQQTTNLSAEDASKLTFAFDEYGITARQSSLLITKLSKDLASIGGIEDGTRALGEGTTAAEKMGDMLYTLGVRTKDAEGNQLTLNDSLGLVADAFQKMPNGIEKTNLATKLFGRQGKDLLPLLNKGAEGLKEMGITAEKLGLVLDQKTVDAVKKNKKEMKEFHAALQGISVQIGLALLPALTLGTKLLVNFAVAFNEHIVPAIKAASKVLNEFLGGAVSTVGPTIAGAIDVVQEAIEGLARSFKNGFIDFDAIANTEGTGKLRKLALVFAAVGAAAKLAITWIQNFVKAIRIISAVVGAVIKDQTNLLRIWEFLPEPVQKILLVIGKLVILFQELIRIARDVGSDIIDLVSGAFTRLADMLGGDGDTKVGGALKKFKEILKDLSEVVIPAMAAAITAFLGLLVVGTVVGFAQAIGGMVAAFGNIGPIKFFTGLIGDFLKGLAKPFEIVMNLVGDAVEGLFNIAKHLVGAGADLAGKVFSFTVNAIGDALGFINGLVFGGIQKLLDANPLRQKVILETTTGTGGVPTPTGAQAEAAGAKTGDSFIKGFIKTIGLPSIGGAIGTIFGNIFSNPEIQFATVFGGYLAFGARIAAAIAKGLTLAGVLEQTVVELLTGAEVITTIAPGGLQIGLAYFDAIVRGILAGFAFKRGDIEGGFLNLIPIITGAIGAAIGSVIPGAGTAAGFAIGVAVGEGILLGIKTVKFFGLKDTILFLLEGGLIGFTAKKLFAPVSKAIINELQALPRQLGYALGAAFAAAIIALIVFPFILLPGYIYREAKKIIPALVRGLTSASEAFNDFQIFLLKLGADAIKAFLKGFTSAANLFEQYNEFLVYGIIAIIKRIPEFFSDLPGLIVIEIRDLPRQIAFVFTKLPGLIAIQVKKIPGVFKDVIEDIVQGFKDGFKKLDDLTGGFLTGIVNAVKNFGRGFVQGFKDVWSDVNRATGGALDDITGKISTAFNGIIYGLTYAMGRIRDIVVGGWQFIVGGVTGVVGGLKGIVSGVFDLAADSLIASIAFVAGKVAGIINKITDIIQYIPGMGGFEATLNGLRDSLYALSGSNIAAPTRQPGEPAPGQPVLPGLPGSGNPGLAAGTQKPLGATLATKVGEQGTELALLGGGGAVLPKGSEVLTATTTSRLLAVLQGLSVAGRGGGGGGGGDLSVNIPLAIDARGLDFESMRAVVHAELDRQLLSSRNRATRAGAPIGSMIG
jgi:hypothetical protein